MLLRFNCGHHLFLIIRADWSETAIKPEHKYNLRGTLVAVIVVIYGILVHGNIAMFCVPNHFVLKLFFFSVLYVFCCIKGQLIIYDIIDMDW